MSKFSFHPRNNLAWNAHNAREKTVETLLETGFPYSRKLTGHTSCLNSLAFSTGDGRWLASAGDDRHVHLFDFHEEDVKLPSCSFVAPKPNKCSCFLHTSKSNVFALCFSANNRYLYCGSTNDPIYKYDLSRLSEPTGFNDRGPPYDVFQGHTDSIRDITCHPSQDEIFMSASEDGRIILRDGRTNSRITRAEGTLQNEAEYTGVRWNPHMEHVFATSDNRGRVCLRDLRTAFGPLSRRSSMPLQQYITTLSTPSVGYLSNQEISSIVWDRDGTKLAVSIQNYFPTIFALTDPRPVAICSAAVLPDGTPIPPGQRTYSNACTIKHGSFGGPTLDRDSFYSSGSDDFRGYVWKIPDIGGLEQQRKHIEIGDWPDQNPDLQITHAAFAPKSDGPRYVPVNLSKPLFHLNGHQSIVNTTLFHPTLLHIATAGIERHVILHSPTASSPCTKTLSLTPPEVRSLPTENAISGRQRRIVRVLTTGEALDPESEDDSDAIALFDEILRTEGGDINPFLTRRYAEQDSDSEIESEIEIDG